MKAILNGVESILRSVIEVDALIQDVEKLEYTELWVVSGDGCSLCALLNSETGWLMYLRNPDDVGFSSRNPDIPLEDDTMQSFRLSNGQVDHYPRRWSLDRAIIFRAISEFAQTGKRPEFIDWHDDSI